MTPYALRLTLLHERLFDNGSERYEVPLLCLVGASNELPESEELDALYDRFLIRRNVAQVSASQLATLARLAAGSLDASDALTTDSAGGGNGAGAGAVGELTMTDFRGTAAAAFSAVEIPDAVIDILCATRNYLQVRGGPGAWRRGAGGGGLTVCCCRGGCPGRQGLGSRGKSAPPCPLASAPH